MNRCSDHSDPVVTELLDVDAIQAATQTAAGQR